MGIVQRLCALLTLGMALLLGRMVFKALADGSVTPLRMGRWSEPEEVQREEDPLTYWASVLGYTALGVASLVVTILGALGHLPLR